MNKIHPSTTRPMIFTLWGIPKGETMETRLVEKSFGKDIISERVAKNLISVLEKHHGCAAVRVMATQMHLTDADVISAWGGKA